MNKPNLRSNSATVALLPWGNVLEDFLDTIGVSLETFCNEFMGSWMFGYVDALRRADVRTVIICMSTRVATPSRFRHALTGATICVLPVPRSYRLLRSKMVNPYGRTVRQTFGELRQTHVLLLPFLTLLKEVGLYLTTPLRLVARELRRESCGAILCQEYEYPRFDACVLLGRLMGLPVFATFQGGDYQRSRLERYLRPYSLRSCTGLIIAPMSEAQRIRVHYGFPADKVARIFNPIDVGLWNPIARNQARVAVAMPRDAHVVVWHGRVSIQQKGLDVLLQAWERLCQVCSGRDVRLLLIGTGKDSEKLQQRIAAMQLRGVTYINEFVHDRSALRSYLSAGDVYAFPSRHEGFPVSLIEAMACGLPVVAAEASGIADILDGGEAAGGVVVPCDDPHELAVALGRFLDDETWARELGRRARQRAQTCFSLEAVGKQLREFLLNGPSDNETIPDPGMAAYPDEPGMRSPG